jgi:hypothetical protein
VSTGGKSSSKNTDFGRGIVSSLPNFSLQNVINEDFNESPIPSELDLACHDREVTNMTMGSASMGNTLTVPIV